MKRGLVRNIRKLEAIFWRLCNVATDFPRKVELADKIYPAAAISSFTFMAMVTMSRLFIIITCKIVSLSSSPSFIASFRRCSASCSSCHLLMETMIFDSSFTLSLIRDDSDDELYIIGAVCMPVCL